MRQIRYSLLNRLLEAELSCTITASRAVCCVSERDSCVDSCATSACIRLVCDAINWVFSLVTAFEADVSWVMELSIVTRC